MPVPPQNITGTTRTYGTFTGGSYQITGGATNLAKSNSPITNPPILIGTDSVAIDLVSNPSNLLTFTNLITRTNNVNTLTRLTAQASTLTVPQGAMLIFTLSGTASTPVVKAINNNIITDSVIGPGEYKVFQAQVNPSIASGIVYAQLYYQS